MDRVKNERPRPYPLRLEPEINQWVKKRAKEGDRSVNAEINRTLRKVKESEEKQPENQ